MREREQHHLARRGFLSSLAALPVTSAVLLDPAKVSAATLASPDAELIALGQELEAAWAIEQATVERLAGDESDEAETLIDTVCERTGTIAERIEDLTATTLAGLAVKLRALDWCRNGDTLDVEELFGPGKHSRDLRLIVAILADIRAAA